MSRVPLVPLITKVFLSRQAKWKNAKSQREILQDLKKFILFFSTKIWSVCIHFNHNLNCGNYSTVVAEFGALSIFAIPLLCL